MSKKSWLIEQVASARKDIDSWPEWMKQAARFEGSDFASEADKEKVTLTEGVNAQEACRKITDTD